MSTKVIGGPGALQRGSMKPTLDANGKRRYAMVVTVEKGRECPSCGEKKRRGGWHILGRMIERDGRRKICWTELCCSPECASLNAIGL